MKWYEQHFLIIVSVVFYLLEEKKHINVMEEYDLLDWKRMRKIEWDNKMLIQIGKNINKNRNVNENEKKTKTKLRTYVTCDLVNHTPKCDWHNR